eukprot:14025865-Alexandrium_andersonii.AAC.1
MTRDEGALASRLQGTKPALRHWSGIGREEPQGKRPSTEEADFAPESARESPHMVGVNARRLHAGSEGLAARALAESDVATQVPCVKEDWDGRTDIWPMVTLQPAPVTSIRGEEDALAGGDASPHRVDVAL